MLSTRRRARRLRASRSAAARPSALYMRASRRCVRRARGNTAARVPRALARVLAASEGGEHARARRRARRRRPARREERRGASAAAQGGAEPPEREEGGRGGATVPDELE